MVKKWFRLAKIGLQLAKTMARKNNQSFQSMMLYNGAKKTFYLLILCINKKDPISSIKILIFDACQSLTAKYTTNYNYINPCISNWEDRALFFFISFLAISYQRIELVICMYVFFDTAC